MTKTITGEMVIDELTKIVEEVGEDFVYPQDDAIYGNGCLYVREDQPSCVVGKILFNLGVPLDELINLDTASDGLSIGISSVMYGTEQDLLPDFEFTGDAAELLENAQSAQDAGARYGKVLASAHSTYRDLQDREISNDSE